MKTRPWNPPPWWIPPPPWKPPPLWKPPPWEPPPPWKPPPPACEPSCICALAAPILPKTAHAAMHAIASFCIRDFLIAEPFPLLKNNLPIHRGFFSSLGNNGRGRFGICHYICNVCALHGEPVKTLPVTAGMRVSKPGNNYLQSLRTEPATITLPAALTGSALTRKPSLPQVARSRPLESKEE